MALVLVVDDEADIRELVRLNLELDGHDVALAGDGAAALAAVAAGLRPDVVLLDLMMPEIDGWEVLRRLKGDPDPDVVTTPVVLLTAKSSDLDQIRGGIEGALRYLTKPFELAVLSTAIVDAVEADEAETRRAVQTSALRDLVRIEKGETVERGNAASPAGGTGGRGVRFSRLERRPDGPLPSSDAAGAAAAVPAPDLGRLSARQSEILDAVGGHRTVREASESLGVSRSNVYTSLQRIAAKLSVASVHELVASARERAG